VVRAKSFCPEENDLVDLLRAYSKHLGKPNDAAELASTAAQHRRSHATSSTAKPARRLRGAEIDDLIASYEITRNVNAVARQFRVSRQAVARDLASRGMRLLDG
jgi:ActR/RegA family two-component response regulator